MLAQIPGARETEVPAVLGVGGSGWRSICGGLASLPGPVVPPAARNPWPDPITVPQARQHDCGRRVPRRRFVHDPRGIAAIRASSPSQRSFSRQKARRTGRGAGADTSIQTGSQRCNSCSTTAVDPGTCPSFSISTSVVLRMAVACSSSSWLAPGASGEKRYIRGKR